MIPFLQWTWSPEPSPRLPQLLFSEGRGKLQSFYSQAAASARWYSDDRFSVLYRFKDNPQQPRDCFDSRGAKQKIPTKKRSRMGLIHFFIESHDEWEMMQDWEEEQGPADDNTYSVCVFFLMCVSGSNIQCVNSSLHVFLCTGRKTIGRQWRRSQRKAWRDEVRQEFLGNDASKNKSSVTAAIWGAEHWHCSQGFVALPSETSHVLLGC